VILPPPDPPRAEPRSAAALANTIRTLPLLPGSVHDLLGLQLKDPDLPEKLQDVIDRDPALAAHVLRVANSAAYRGQARIETVPAAISRVGAPMIVGNAIQSAVHRIFDPYGGMGRRLGQFAVLEANIMAALAVTWEPRLGIAPESAYVAGLLHDIGHFVMAIKLSKRLESFGHRRISPDELVQREVRAFGFDHQAAGRMLANHWKLPESLTVVIAAHHQRRDLRSDVAEPSNHVIDLLQITDRLSRLVVQSSEQRGKGEALVADWLITAEAQELLRPVGGTAAEVLAALPAALTGVDRDHRMADDKPGPSSS
jgi:HD-like signal output (HDOD) protein